MLCLSFSYALILGVANAYASTHLTTNQKHDHGFIRRTLDSYAALQARGGAMLPELQNGPVRFQRAIAKRATEITSDSGAATTQVAVAAPATASAFERAKFPLEVTAISIIAIIIIGVCIYLIRKLRGSSIASAKAYPQGFNEVLRRRSMHSTASTLSFINDEKLTSLFADPDFNTSRPSIPDSDISHLRPGSSTPKFPFPPPTLTKDNSATYNPLDRTQIHVVHTPPPASNAPPPSSPLPPLPTAKPQIPIPIVVRRRSCSQPPPFIRKMGGPDKRGDISEDSGEDITSAGTSDDEEEAPPMRSPLFQNFGMATPAAAGSRPGFARTKSDFGSERPSSAREDGEKKQKQKSHLKARSGWD